MRARAALIVLVVPFALVRYLGEWVAEHEARGLAEGLTEVGEGVLVAERRQRARDGDEVALWRANLAGLLDEVAAAQQDAEEPSPGVRHGVGRTTARGLFVSAAAVLVLAQQGARPSGIPVPSSGARPAGLMLVGVSQLGVGLRDGDILTHALGRPAVSEAAVVGAVIRARGARQSQLSGRIWRDGKTFPLVVAQPYVEAT